MCPDVFHCFTPMKLICDTPLWGALENIVPSLPTPTSTPPSPALIGTCSWNILSSLISSPEMWEVGSCIWNSCLQPQVLFHQWWDLPSFSQSCCFNKDLNKAGLSPGPFWQETLDETCFPTCSFLLPFLGFLEDGAFACDRDRKWSVLFLFLKIYFYWEAERERGETSKQNINHLPPARSLSGIRAHNPPQACALTRN